MPTPRPPSNEQVLIADTIDRKARFAHDAMRNARLQIILANEFRTRMIADVVTGKLDVRASAAAVTDTELCASDDRKQALNAAAGDGAHELAPVLS